MNLSVLGFQIFLMLGYQKATAAATLLLNSVFSAPQCIIDKIMIITTIKPYLIIQFTKQMSSSLQKIRQILGKTLNYDKKKKSLYTVTTVGVSPYCLIALRNKWLSPVTRVTSDDLGMDPFTPFKTSQLCAISRNQRRHNGPGLSLSTRASVRGDTARSRGNVTFSLHPGN